jgi:Xaa-Pro aminopeptidase
MVNRRIALGSLAAASVSASFAGRAQASAHSSGSKLPPPIKGPRMNFEQVDRVLPALGLDALVLGDGINVRHATGIRPVVTRMGFPPSLLAVVTRRPTDRLAAVMPEFSYYYTLADVHRGEGFPVYLFSAALWPAQEREGDDPKPMDVFPDRKAVPLDAIETARYAATADMLRAQGASDGQAAALRRALREQGVSKGRIGVDHPAVAAAVAKALPDAEIVDADDALRRIRLVKSPVEIQLMRIAAQANVDAALEALQGVRAGASYRELRAEFFAASARRGQRGVFMVVDRTSDEAYDADFRDGQAFLIDCVSEYEGYHGDYGRTVFIGEPARSMRQATQAIGTAWDAVREGLKPGLRFSDIRALGQAALKGQSAEYRVPFNPHSVGLYHTDHVGSGVSPPLGDIQLEPGMILSIDCPLLESGIGGSAHLEDLMLITADGSEPINDTGRQVIEI